MVLESVLVPTSLTAPMEPSLRFRSLSLSPFPPLPFSPFHRQIPITPKFNPHRPFSVSALRRPPIEGVTDDLNAVALRNLDFAYTRRQVRAAFADVHQNLDHCLFKVSF